MATSKQQEENIKERIQKMPDIDPFTEKEELYQRISTQMKQEPKRKAKRFVLVPAFSAIFVALLVFLMVSYDEGKTVQNEMSADKASHENSTLQESSSLGGESTQKDQLMGIAEDEESQLVIQNINSNELLFRGEVIDEQKGYVIPVSYVLPDDQTDAFYDKQLRLIENKLAELFQTGKNQHEIFPNVDRKRMSSKSTEKVSYKIYRKMESNMEFLIPITPKKSTDFHGALLEMKNIGKASNIKPSIPSKVSFSVSVVEETIQLTLQDNVLLSNNKQYKNMIEAILMTAKSFGYNAVIFNNTTIEQIGPYDLMEPIDVPLAVNPV